MEKLLLSTLLTTGLFLPGYSQTDTLPKRDSAVAMQPVYPYSTNNVVPEKREPVYKLNLAVDIPVTAVSAGWTLFAFSKIYSKDPTPDGKIMALKESNIPGFDRWGVKPWDEKIDKASYIPFYVVMPLPLLSLLDKDMRKDILKISFMYLEAMSVTGVLYTSGTYWADRYRPYVYSAETPWDKRINGNGRNSFPAGHIALVATSMYFMANVYKDYHPESKAKWVFYGLATATTVGTAWMRHEAGMHFPSDILLGTAIGVANGFLFPAMHKNKAHRKLTVYPFSGQSHGLALMYKL
jgi:membrane-associated phospholipid phosphatase